MSAFVAFVVSLAFAVVSYLMVGDVNIDFTRYFRD